MYIITRNQAFLFLTAVGEIKLKKFDCRLPVILRQKFVFREILLGKRSNISSSPRRPFTGDPSQRIVVQVGISQLLSLNRLFLQYTLQDRDTLLVSFWAERTVKEKGIFVSHWKMCLTAFKAYLLTLNSFTKTKQLFFAGHEVKDVPKPRVSPFTLTTEEEINKQINRELYAHYTYMSMVSF